MALDRDPPRREEFDGDPLAGLTALLDRAVAGDLDARDEVYARCFDRFRRYGHLLLGSGVGRTLQPTALVAEAWLRLRENGLEDSPWSDRRQFLATVARTMRWVVVDYERSRRTLRRSPPGERVELEEVHGEYQERAQDLVQLEEALGALGATHPDLVEIVELRFFLRCTEAETAALLGVSERTVQRRFERTRQWLFRWMTGTRPRRRRA